jgi:hypothetical protein
LPGFSERRFLDARLGLSNGPAFEGDGRTSCDVADRAAQRRARSAAAKPIGFRGSPRAHKTVLLKMSHCIITKMSTDYPLERSAFGRDNC